MSGKLTNKGVLIDSFGRTHDYLRLSITDRCNFNCLYCKPDKCNSDNKIGHMSPNEIGEIADAFIYLGITKIRITGGEPLMRKDFAEIADILGKKNIKLALTTNAFYLDKYLDCLKENNFQFLNISLDSLNADKFQKITGSNRLQKILSNIEKAIAANLTVKINTVVIRDLNSDEIADIASLTIRKPISVRFIEFMPFKGNNWNFGRLIRHTEIVDELKKYFQLEKIENEKSETASYYKIPGSVGKIGVISTVSQPFCSSCNRIRLTSDGKIKSCLFGIHEFDLINPLRQHATISELIYSALKEKSFEHGGKKTFREFPEGYLDNRDMFAIGG